MRLSRIAPKRRVPKLRMSTTWRLEKQGSTRSSPCLNIAALPTRLHPHRHLYLLSQAGKNRHQAVNGEAVQLRLADTGKIGCRDAGQGLGGADGQLAIVEDADDFGRQQRAQLLAVGVGVAEVAE